MFEIAALKPVLTALIMPPAGPLLLVLLGWWLLRQKKARTFSAAKTGLGRLWVGLGLLSLWLLSCNAVAVWLANNLVGQPPALTPAQLKASGAQAVVVLGGGVDHTPPEWRDWRSAQDASQLRVDALERLRYGAFLAKQSGLPLAYSGGVGWAAGNQRPEATVAANQSQREFGVPVSFVEARSRDTRENARESWAMLSTQNIKNVVVVTNAWHMRRSARAYNEAGFRVTAAPMGYIQPLFDPTLEWLPTGVGLQHSRMVLREWLGYQLGQ